MQSRNQREGKFIPSTRHSIRVTVRKQTRRYNHTGLYTFYPIRTRTGGPQ